MLSRWRWFKTCNAVQLHDTVLVNQPPRRENDENSVRLAPTEPIIESAKPSPVGGSTEIKGAEYRASASGSDGAEPPRHG